MISLPPSSSQALRCILLPCSPSHPYLPPAGSTDCSSSNFSASLLEASLLLRPQCPWTTWTLGDLKSCHICCNYFLFYNNRVWVLTYMAGSKACGHCCVCVWGGGLLAPAGMTVERPVQQMRSGVCCGFIPGCRFVHDLQVWAVILPQWWLGMPSKLDSFN